MPLKYSVVVPIFNDGALAHDFAVDIAEVFQKHLDRADIESELEVIFVDDGSRNDSAALLKKVRDEFPFVKVVILARNFGQHIAISCGYRHARGTYVGYLNVDREDPPKELIRLFRELETHDCDMVGGLYTRRDVGFITKVTSYLFHVFLNRLTGYDVPVNSSTIRVMSRRFLDTYNALSERSRYLPGLEMWLGAKYRRIPVEHRPRRVGTSSYSFRRRLRMAIDSIISFSDYPLRLAVKSGFAVAAGGLLLTIVFIIDKLFFRAVLPGYVSTIAVIVLLGGAQIMVTGLASLYVGRVLHEVQGRPLYVVRERVGVEKEPTLD